MLTASCVAVVEDYSVRRGSVVGLTWYGGGSLSVLCGGVISLFPELSVRGSFVFMSHSICSVDISLYQSRLLSIIDEKIRFAWLRIFKRLLKLNTAILKIITKV